MGKKFVLNIPDEVLLKIGEIIAASCYVEHFLEQVIFSLLGDGASANFYERFTISRLGMDRNIGLFRDLVDYHCNGGDRRCLGIQELPGKVSKAYSIRNYYAHKRLGYDEEKGIYPLQAGKKENRKFRRDYKNIREIERDYLSVFAALDALYNFLKSAPDKKKTLDKLSF